jgi:hypothetical protein
MGEGAPLRGSAAAFIVEPMKIAVIGAGKVGGNLGATSSMVGGQGRGFTFGLRGAK